MNSTTKITMDTDRIIFGEGCLDLESGDELGFKFSFYKSDGHLRALVENGKVSIHKLADINQRAKECAREAISVYTGEAI